MSADRNNQPSGSRQYVSPIVAAESGGRAGDVFAMPYEDKRATPADHTVEEELYDWSGAGKQPATSAPHFNDNVGGVITWAWRGIICLGLIMPVAIVSWLLTFYLMTTPSYSWGVWPLIIPLAALIALGVACGLTSLIHFTKSNQPILTLILSLLGIALGAIMLFFLASSIGQWQAHIAAHTCVGVILTNCNAKLESRKTQRAVRNAEDAE